MYTPVSRNGILFNVKDFVFIVYTNIIKNCSILIFSLKS